MADVRLSRREAEGTGLPPVCIQCGAHGLSTGVQPFRKTDCKIVAALRGTGARLSLDRAARNECIDICIELQLAA